MKIFTRLDCSLSRSSHPSPAEPLRRARRSRCSTCRTTRRASCTRTSTRRSDGNGSAAPGRTCTIKQSHGGSGAQARAVIDGLEADVVTLALAYDIEEIAARAQDPSRQLAEQAAAQQHAVRVDRGVRRPQGQPEGDQGLERPGAPGLQVITANPKTSGGARWNYLGAWGYALQTERRKRGRRRGTSSRSSTRTSRCSTPARVARRRRSWSVASATC